MKRVLPALLVALSVSAAGIARADAPAAKAETEGDKPTVVLYAFFATWCVPCRVELPHIERLHRTYAARGLDVVLVSEDAPSSAQNIPAFLARYNVTARWILDNESELLERFNPTASLPFTAILDGSGRQLYAHAGYEPGDEKKMEQVIAKALAAAEKTAQIDDKRDVTGDKAVRADAAVASASPAVRPLVSVRSTSQGLGVWRSSRFDPNPDMDGTLQAAAGRIEVSGETETVRAGVRVDGAVISDELSGDDSDARLERARAQVELGPVTLSGGDGYVQFGHGVSLSLRRVDPLGLDTSLRGARVDLETDRIETKVLAGWTNPQNIDPIALSVVDDANDLIAGAEVAIKLGQRGRVGPYALLSDASEAAPDGSDVRWMLGGAAASLTLGSVRVAADGAVGTRSGMSAMGDETTWAGYGSAQWTRGRVTVLVDAKYYRHWSIGRSDRSLLYHEPPTLEREDQEVPANDNAIGARSRVEVRLPNSVTVFGNALAYRYAEDESDPIDGKLAMHGYVGGDKRWDSGASVGLTGGFRRETDEDGAESLRLWHLDVDAALPLPRRLAVTFKWNHRSETKILFNPLKFERGLAVLGLSRSGWGALSVLGGYSTEFRNGVAPTWYPAAELLVHLPRGSNLRLFFGRLSGGRICVSGSCRDVPPFEGARLDLQIRL